MARPLVINWLASTPNTLDSWYFASAISVPAGVYTSNAPGAFLVLPSNYSLNGSGIAGAMNLFPGSIPSTNPFTGITSYTNQMPKYNCRKIGLYSNIAGAIYLITGLDGFGNAISESKTVATAAVFSNSVNQYSSFSIQPISAIPANTILSIGLSPSGYTCTPELDVWNKIATSSISYLVPTNSTPGATGTGIQIVPYYTISPITNFVNNDPSFPVFGINNADLISFGGGGNPLALINGISVNSNVSNVVGSGFPVTLPMSSATSYALNGIPLTSFLTVFSFEGGYPVLTVGTSACTINILQQGGLV